jgi:uncharacterized protein YbjT (DUF2867 family)
MASVLITGASKGIGRATAAEFARRGHRVIATARDPSALAGLTVDQRLALGVTNPDSITSAVGEAGEIDVLVSNAAEIFAAAVEATPPRGVRAAAGHQHDRCPAGGAVGPARDARPRPRAAAVHVQHRRAHRPAAPGGLRRDQMGPRGAGRGPGHRGGPAGDRGRAARTGPGQLRSARPRHHLHPARRSLRPPAHQGRRAPVR